MIDVGVGNSKNWSICLREKQTINDRRYIALSHRWGESMSETLKDNIDSRKNSINHADLPTNFQDAIEVTRQLGIRYLWIDSLCIIQDDPEDWRRESRLMGDVFNSAYCTISVRVTSGPGFLTNHYDRKCVRLPYRKHSSLYICEQIDDFSKDVEDAALSNRGWVFQERVLSRRTLYFTDHQVYWECGVCIRCETLTRMEKYVGYPYPLTGKLLTITDRVDDQ